MKKKTAYNSGTERHNSTKSRCVSPQMGVPVYPSIFLARNMKIIKNQGLLILNYGYGLWLWCLMAAVNGMAMSFQKTWTATAENERFSPKILKERFQDIEVENLRNFEAPQIFRHRWTDGLIVADSIQSFGVPNTSNEK